jgi:hypothetical protein
MTDAVAHRVRLRVLAEQLVAEYSGALPPGRILGVVYRADRLMAAVPASRRAMTCEAVVRRMLTDALAQDAGRVGPPT